MKTTAVIAVRTGSSRLPGKAFMPILGKPMVERMIERVRHSQKINDILIATTQLPGDDILETLASQIGVGCFRGSENDLLGRIHAAVSSSDADHVVELLGDNPLVHSNLIDDVMHFYLNGHYDYAASVTNEYRKAGPQVKRFPIGIRVQVFSREVIGRCEKLAQLDYDRENSTNFIYDHPEIFNLGYFEAIGKWAFLNRPELTFAVNYRENFQLVSQIFEQRYLSNKNFTLEDVLAVYDSDSSLLPLMGNPTELKVSV